MAFKCIIQFRYVPEAFSSCIYTMCLSLLLDQRTVPKHVHVYSEIKHVLSPHAHVQGGEVVGLVAVVVIVSTKMAKSRDLAT